jgi:hypothetical protein
VTLSAWTARVEKMRADHKRVKARNWKTDGGFEAVEG